jgi:N-acetylmuramoyl-L-alanine amidase
MKGIKLIALSAFSTAFLSFTPVNKKYIIIDAGHGGNDMGAVYQDTTEKDITLHIAHNIEKINAIQDKYEVILTRGSDDDVILADRTAKINDLKPEMVISLHVNSNPKEETPDKGTEIFVQNSDSSRKLAEKISKKFNVRKIEERNLHILKESQSPTVLVELGFVNNTEDRRYMTSEKGQQEIAKKFIEVIKEY